MDKTEKSPLQLLVVRSLPCKVDVAHAVLHTITFHVIVTCRYSSKVLAAIEAIEDEYAHGEGFKIFFDYVLPFCPSCSYKCMMKRLREHTIETVAEVAGLNEYDITTISTDCSWEFWEKRTGRSYRNEESASEIAVNGTILLPAFDRQIKECRKRGETVDSLADRVFAEYHGYPLSLAD